ncbi:MAG: dienelactone hydrolase family protein [Halanaeroarchaeum sp.]
MPEPSSVTIATDGVTLPGDLTIPADATGLVVFAHGSGSSRKSPRNQFVAEQLVDSGLATLLFDLLTEAEDRDRENRFDIELLTDRLIAAREWVGGREDVGDRPIGYFGSSTGAAAALRAAARQPEGVEAVVSRGGRVDLAESAFDAVDAPTRLIVGGADTQVLELNRDAAARLACETDVTVVEGAGHLFEGQGELEAVADHAGEWFVEHLTRD